MSGRIWILNPDMEIPVSASKVHAITAEHARGHGQDYATGYAEIRAEIDKAWVGVHRRGVQCDVRSHDYARRGLRLGHAEPAPAAVFDPLVIDKAMDQFRSGKCTLTT